MLIRARCGTIKVREQSRAKLASAYELMQKRSARCAKKRKVERSSQSLSGTIVSPNAFRALLAATRLAPQTHAVLALCAEITLALGEQHAPE